jgi:mannose-6-phosphate isomerase-like protein (cupin superfamily)
VAPRRIVTGTDSDGRNVIASDGAPTRYREFVHIPGQTSAIVWATDGTETVPISGEDPTPGVTSVVPGPGGTVIILVDLPPDSVYATEGVDPVAGAAELALASPGLLEHFEEGSTFHATPTVDYMILLDGELWLVVDDGEETLVKAGDIVIQNANRHAWQNRSDSPARFACILVGTAR